MSFVNDTKESTVMTNEANAAGRVYGDFTEDELVSMLGSAPTDSTPIPGSGGKTHGQMRFDDVVISSAMTNDTKNATTHTNDAKL